MSSHPTDPASIDPARYAARAFADALPIPTWLLDADGQCVHVNAAWVESVGDAASHHHGWSWLEALHPDDRAPVLDAWSGALATRTALVCDVRLAHVGGTHRWHEVRATPTLDAEGAPLAWTGCAVDVHELRELRRVASEREIQLEAALEAGTMARFAYDLEHRVLTADDALGRMLPAADGPSPAEGVEGFAEHIHPEDRGRWLGQIRRAMDPRTPTFFVDFRLRGSRGRSGRRFGSRGRVAFDEAGRPAAISGVLFELSDGSLTDPRD